MSELRQLRPVGTRQDAAGPLDGTDPARVERLLTLALELSQILLTADVTEAALVEAMQAACKTQGWAAGTYWRLDETDGVLRILAGWSVDNDRLRTVFRQALELTCESGVGLVGEVVRTGIPLWVPNLRDDSRVARRMLVDETGSTSALLVPIRVQERTIGVIDFNAEHIPDPGSGNHGSHHRGREEPGRHCRGRRRGDRHATGLLVWSGV